MGKLEKKAVFSLYYGDKTTTCHDRAIENRRLCHSDVSASSPPYGENTAFSPTFPLVLHDLGMLLIIPLELQESINHFYGTALKAHSAENAISYGPTRGRLPPRVYPRFRGNG